MKIVALLVLLFALPVCAQERYLELYEIGDLIRPVRHFPGPKLGLDQGEVTFEENEDEDDDPLFTADRLVELIEQLIAKHDSDAHVQIISGGSLAVIADTKAQRSVGQLLRGVRDEKSGIYSINAQIVAVPRDALERFHVSAEQATATPDSKEIHATIRDLTVANKVQLLTAPRLAVLPKETASVSMTNQMAYVADYELKDAVVDPVISTLTLGTTLQLMVKQTPSAKEPVGNLLEWTAKRATAPLPFPTAKVGDLGEIQLPEVSIRTTTGRTLLGDSQCLVVANLGSDEAGQCELLIVHVEGPHR
ncbi:MAG: hypothetical protein AAF581_08265 [Planctomycetota bacterium]